MKRGDIYWYKCLNNNGSVQNGVRPVLILQNDMGNYYSTTTIVCTITSKIKKDIPTHVCLGCKFGLIKTSWLLCEQIFTVNKKDLYYYIGTIEDVRILQEIEKALKISLGID